MTFKERRYECVSCGQAVQYLAWNTDPAPVCPTDGAPMVETGLIASVSRNQGVIDDQLEGGARFCETMGHDPVWLDGTKSQWRREVAARGLTNVVRRDSAYYAKQRKQHDERLRDEKQVRA